VRELERALIFRSRLPASAEAAEQVGARGVEVPVAVEVEPVDEDQPGFSPSTSATAIARFSSRTAEPVSPTSSP